MAQRAGITARRIYHQSLLARIRAHTYLAPAPSSDDNCSNGIIAALCAQRIAKEEEVIASLKTMLRQRDTTIAILYGKLEQHTRKGGQSSDSPMNPPTISTTVANRRMSESLRYCQSSAQTRCLVRRSDIDCENEFGCLVA